jgi:non-specific serine/threonine protein kinase
LRAAIDWSYDLLTPEEQILLRRLAVFDAGCTLDMAEGVCTGNGVTVSSTLDLLSSLVNKSLVMAETSGRAEARYRLLETIREYALEKLKEAGELIYMRDRHLDFFVTRAEEIEPKLHGSSYQGLWLNWFVGELDNLRSALDWSLESGQVTSGLRLAGALWLFWDMHSHQSEGLARLEQFLSRTSERTLARAKALFAAGLFKYRRGEYRSSRAYLQESLSISHELGDKRVRALALDRLSSVAYTQGKYAEALLFADESLALYKELDDRRGIAQILNAKGELARLQSEYETAGEFYEESLALSRELGDRFGISKSLHNLAYVVQHQGDYQRAAMLFKEDLITSQEVGDKVSTALAVAGLAGIAGLTKEPKRAARLFGAVQTALATLGIILDAIDRSDLDRDIQMVKTQLDPTEFATLWEEGCTMSLERAIEYALSSPAPLTTPTPKPHEEIGGLTEREREVVTLIAQGKRNNEIAEQLVISKRTVEKHVANILSKLELTSRAQIVRWVMEHNLTSTST